jgi:phage terminase large subunit GpA-like protein
VSISAVRPGLYEFRRFHVLAGHVDEVVALSTQAWETFETGHDYAAEPQGLFCPPADADDVVRMMLVTWYDSFGSWETSRSPAPDAMQNFQKRQALTLTTYAVATRLVAI